MKVLHLLSSTGYHGAENMVTELVHQLSALGVTNHLGLFYGQYKSNREILEAAGDYVAGSALFPCAGRLDVKTVLLLRRYIKEHGFDIVHSHKYKTNLYSAIASASTGARLVSTCHNWLGESLKMRFYAGLDKFVLKRFDAAVGVSNEVVTELNKHLSSGAVHKVDNGIDVARFQILVGKEAAKRRLGLDGKKVIGYVGRLSPEKGLSYLLTAVRRVAETERDVYAVIVGDGEYGEDLKREAASLGIADRVVFTGRRCDTPLLYSAMDIFVLPSLKEAFPMVVLEAMSCGLPVVATSVGEVPRIIEDNVSGFIVEPRDPEAIVGRISALLSDSWKREAVGKAANEVVTSKHSSVRMALEYIDIYKKVLNLR